MKYDNIYEIKENKKDNNLKTQNLITSTQRRVPNNTKTHQRKVEMQEKVLKNSSKMREREREREREKQHFVCEKIMNRMEKRIVNL